MIQYNYTQVYNSKNNFILNNVLFYFCYSFTPGGGIFFSFSESNLTLTNSIFQSCFGTTYGGGICIYYANNINLLNIYFYNCSTTLQGPSFMVHGTAYPSNSFTMFYSSENSPLICTVCSTIGSNLINVSNLNISNTKTTTQCAGIYFSHLIFPLYSTYSQIINSKGTSFLGFYKSIHSNLFYFNFINNSCTNSWIDIHTITQYPNIAFSNFINNSDIIFYRYVFGATSGYPILIYCLISNLYNLNYHLQIELKLNSFNTIGINNNPILVTNLNYLKKISFNNLFFTFVFFFFSN